MSTFQWDWSIAWSTVPLLLDGMQVTLIATFFGSILAFLLGLVWVLIRLAGIPIITPAVNLFAQFLRGTPFLVQLFFLFYVLPTWGITFSPLVTGIIGLGLFNSAQTSEIYRAGIEDVPRGQWEASLTIGLPLKRVWLGIILPQTFHRVLPVLGNVIISMFKETSVLSTITVFELLAQGMDLGSQSFRFIEPLTMVGMMYLVISYAAARGVRILEARNAVHH
jgi:polar amino acid transport system permease protein